MNNNKDISKGPREESYVSDGLNAKKYENWRHKFDDFFDCEQYFMQNHFANTTTLLDLGGNSGGLYGALNEKFPKICYTSLDLDAKALENGRKIYPNANFIEGNFFNIKLDEQFDTVSYLQQLYYYPNWNETLKKVLSFADRNVFIESRFRIDGNTITDPNLSFTYYLGMCDSKWTDTDRKVPWIVINIYEFINFILNDFPVSKLEIYGYYQNPPPPHFIPMNKKQVVAACCWITLDRENLKHGRNAEVILNIPNSFY